MHLVPRLSTRALAAALVAVGGLSVASGRAAGSCGDYVRFTGHQPTAEHPSPMSGPHRAPECSKGPASPAVPVTAPPRLAGDTEQPFAATDADDRLAADPGWPRVPAEADRPIPLHTSIFHPPRAA